MYILYSAAHSLLFVILLPYFLYQALRHGKYAGSFTERLGFLPAALRDEARPTIWVHAVSVGEFNAARPLIARLKEQMPGFRIVVSTTTLTAQRLARAASGQAFDAAFYFPFDWALTTRRALAHINPQLVVLLETELWPNFLRQCRKRGIATALVNGRISLRSFSRYRTVRRFLARVLADLSLLLMQSPEDAERLLALGASRSHVRICGNLKYDIDIGGQKADDSSQALDQHFALSRCKWLMVAGSTAPGEEQILLEALRTVRRREGLHDARLLIAPRHPERFEEVARLLAASGFSFARRSTLDQQATAPAQEAARHADVLLLDTIGELAGAYKFAAVVFIGGSLVPRGGHNPIEPAVYAKPVIVGPHTENFRAIIADFAQAKAIVQLKESGRAPWQELAEAFIRLLTDRETALAMGQRGREMLVRNQGATDCTVAAIREIMRVKPDTDK